MIRDFSSLIRELFLANLIGFVPVFARRFIFSSASRRGANWNKGTKNERKMKNTLFAKTKPKSVGTKAKNELNSPGKVVSVARVALLHREVDGPVRCRPVATAGPSPPPDHPVPRTSCAARVVPLTPLEMAVRRRLASGGPLVGGQRAIASSARRWTPQHRPTSAAGRRSSRSRPESSHDPGEVA